MISDLLKKLLFQYKRKKLLNNGIDIKMETTKEKLPNQKVKAIVLISLIVAVGVLTPIILWAIGSNEKPIDKGYTDISVEVAYLMINETEDYPDLIVLDVRTQSEYDAGHINNSILIPNTDLESRIGELSGSEDTEIIVYCRTGARSALASAILVNNNFTKVFNMYGGFEAWVAADYFVPD